MFVFSKVAKIPLLCKLEVYFAYLTTKFHTKILIIAFQKFNCKLKLLIDTIFNVHHCLR